MHVCQLLLFTRYYPGFLVPVPLLLQPLHLWNALFKDVSIVIHQEPVLSSVFLKIIGEGFVFSYCPKMHIVPRAHAQLKLIFVYCVAIYADFPGFQKGKPSCSRLEIPETEFRTLYVQTSLL